MKKLDVDQRYVFSLYIALYTLGHISEGGDAVKDKSKILAESENKLPIKTKNILTKAIIKTSVVD